MDFESAAGYAAADEEEFHQTFVEELQQAALIQTKARGAKDLTGGLVGPRIAELSSPENYLRWGAMLRGDVIASLGFDVPDWSKPNRKYWPQMTLPSMRGTQVKLLLIAIDISGSVGKDLLGKFISNVTPAADRADEVIVVTFDGTIRETYRTRRPRTIFKGIKLNQGLHGGTNVKAVFELADKVKPISIVIFTDGHVWLPDKPYRNTYWVLPENGLRQPWGRNYHMKVTW
jgi:predicted metal-dependent peptidase